MQVGPAAEGRHAECERRREGAAVAGERQPGPPCRATYFAYESIIEKYKDRPKDFKYGLKHFPLDPSCNASVANLVHPAACDAAAAAVMAGPKGTFDKLTDWF